MGHMSGPLMQSAGDLCPEPAPPSPPSPASHRLVSLCTLSKMSRQLSGIAAAAHGSRACKPNNGADAAQGVNTGLQDAQILVRALKAAGGDVDAALAAFNTERHKEVPPCLIAFGLLIHAPGCKP